MTKESVRIGLDMARLCRSILLEKKLKPEYIGQLDSDKLYSLCEYHCLTAMVCMALEYNGVQPDEKWIQAKSKAIRKNMLLDAERAQICRFLEQNKIWYMPLKGSILKEMYPQLGMRQMSDNDILFDALQRKSVMQFMKDRDYHLKGDGGNHCDEWLKEPVYNFEMHLNLFTPMQDKSGYFEHTKERLICVDGKRYKYRFTDEDFYIYMVAHAHKHYRGGGTGFRTLVDFYIFLDKKEENLNFEYIKSELDKLEMTEFEQLMRHTAQHFFSENSQLSDEEKKAVRFMIGAGTYGNMDNLIKKTAQKLNADSKAVYLIRRFFPTIEWWNYYFPKTIDHKILIIPYFFYRLGRMLTVRRKNILNELKIILRKNEREFRVK